MARPTVTKPHGRVVQTYLDDADYRAVRRIAGENCQSASAFLRKLVVDHLRSRADANPSNGRPPRAPQAARRSKPRAGLAAHRAK